jgi:hypothetical protein
MSGTSAKGCIAVIAALICVAGALAEVQMGGWALSRWLQACSVDLHNRFDDNPTLFACMLAGAQQLPRKLLGLSEASSSSVQPVREGFKAPEPSSLAMVEPDYSYGTGRVLTQVCPPLRIVCIQRGLVYAKISGDGV